MALVCKVFQGKQTFMVSSLPKGQINTMIAPADLISLLSTDEMIANATVLSVEFFLSKPTMCDMVCIGTTQEVR